MTDVAVLIPTLRRPDMLVQALASIQAQAGVETRLREVVVIDNDPDASARDVVEAASTDSDLRIVYVHESRPGVATARNAGLRATSAPLIAFLDDDEIAARDWLAQLIDTQERFDADAVFSPITTLLPTSVRRHRAYLEGFFARRGPDRSGLIAKAYGCGASLLRRASALPGPAPFDPAFDQTGGEDDVLFQALAARGGRLAWAAEARAFEQVPASRAGLTYTYRRAFAYGQGPTKSCARAGDWAGVGRWMAIGVAQGLVWGIAALCAWALGLADRAELADRAIRGAGKVFWAPRLAARFYGEAGLARMTPAPSTNLGG